MSKRRQVLVGAGALVAAGAAGLTWRAASPDREEMPTESPGMLEMVREMPYRAFGKTGIRVSELSFGAWGIGGKSYGPADRAESLAALARSEELGCNLVDTAAVYGDSEAILGEFLNGRRSRWVVATKYSGQPEGMTATIESQLRRLSTDYIDFYMIHWLPRGKESYLLSELERLKREGKARFIGVSLYNAADIDYVLDKTSLDGIMVPFSILDPDPFLSRRERLARSGISVMIRSVLKEGFLAGKFTRETRFTNPDDQRSTWELERIVRTVEQVEQFRFLEREAGSMARAAIGYPLSFPEVSTVVVGAKRLWEAEENFGGAAGFRLAPETLQRIFALQKHLDLRTRMNILARLKQLLP